MYFEGTFLTNMQVYKCPILNIGQQLTVKSFNSDGHSIRQVSLSFAKFGRALLSCWCSAVLPRVSVDSDAKTGVTSEARDDVLVEIPLFRSGCDAEVTMT